MMHLLIQSSSISSRTPHKFQPVMICLSFSLKSNSYKPCSRQLRPLRFPENPWRRKLKFLPRKFLCRVWWFHKLPSRQWRWLWRYSSTNKKLQSFMILSLQVYPLQQAFPACGFTVQRFNLAFQKSSQPKEGFLGISV